MFKRVLMLTLFFMLSLTPLQARAQLTAADELPWWNDRVFYQVFVRSFYDSDGNGAGDLRGLIERLDYLNDGDPATTDDLGVTGLWLMPVTEGLSYHGYNVTDYYSIDSQYGTEQDFRDLMAAARERGIAVIVDLVLNHTSVQHPWFQASLQGDAEFADWYVWADEDPGFRGPDNQHVWHRLNDRYYYGLFESGMPDLNLTNPEVTAALYDIADYWLTDLGVDGFRLDAVKHYVEEGEAQEDTSSTRAWAEGFHNHVRETKPEALLVGEIWSPSFNIAPYIPASVDIAFEFDLATAMVTSAQQRNPGGVLSLQKRALDLYPFGQYAAFLTNHDQNRVLSQLRGDLEAGKVAASLLLTGPGVPFIYYGEEIGMMGDGPHERVRTPMQWTNDPVTAGFTTGDEVWEPLAEDGIENTVADQTDDPDSLLSHYRALIHLRNAHPALRTGTWTEVESEARRVYAFLREHEAETLLVVINMDREPVSDYALSIEASGLTAESVEVLYGPATDAAAPALNAGGGFEGYLPLPELPARSTLILRLG